MPATPVISRIVQQITAAGIVRILYYLQEQVWAKSRSSERCQRRALVFNEQSIRVESESDTRFQFAASMAVLA